MSQLIAFEGIDGAGKSTQIPRLQKWIEAHYRARDGRAYARGIWCTDSERQDSASPSRRARFISVRSTRTRGKSHQTCA